MSCTLVLFLIFVYGTLSFIFNFNIFLSMALWAVLNFWPIAFVNDHVWQPYVILGRTHCSKTCLLRDIGNFSSRKNLCFFQNNSSLSWSYIWFLLLSWHRRKLPFEILNFATKIGKFCHKKLPNLPHFAIKIAKFCKLSFLFRVYFGPGGPEYLIDLKMHTKMIKNINLISKQEHQSLQREASKFNYTRYSQEMKLL